MLEAEEQLCASLHLQLYAAGTEHFVCRTDIEFHIGDVKFLLVIMLYFAYFLLPVVVHDLPLGVLVVFLLGEHVRRSDVGIAHLGPDDVRARLRLVFNGRGDVIRILKVHGRHRAGQLAVVLRAELFHVRRSPESTIRLGDEIRHIFGFQFFAGSYFLGTSLTRSFTLRFLGLSARFLFLFCFLLRRFLRLLRFLSGSLFRH